MEFSILDVVTPLRMQAMEAMTLTATIGWRLGVIIASIGIILAVSLRIAGGGGGIIPMVVAWIVTTGLVLGAVSFWPAIMQECFNTATEISTAIGGSGIQLVDVIERGADQFNRLFQAAGAQLTLMDWQSFPVAVQLILVGVWLFAMHVVTAFIFAAAILEFWLVGAILPIVLPLALVQGLQSVGFGALVWVAGMTLRLVFIALVLASSTDLINEWTVPAMTEEPDVTLTITAAIAATVGAFLVWQASSWGRSVIQAASGASSIAGLTAQAISISGRAGRGARAGA